MHTRILVLLLVLLVCGCRQAKRKVVGVVPKGANHTFWQTVHAGAIKAALEFDLDVEWNAPALEIDAGRQIAILESMINRRLDGIAVAPVDKQSLVGVIDKAHDAGVPLAVFDSDVDTNKRLTYVATDNREGGRLAARKLGELMTQRTKIGIISFMPGSASTMERVEGFTTELKTQFPHLRIVQTAYGMADRAKSRAVTENIINAHPDLGGIFADNESSAAGAAMAIRAVAGKGIDFVGFDSNEQLVSDLQDRLIDGLVLQDPFTMGYESVRAIGLKLRGESPKPHINSGVILITKDDLEKPDVTRLLTPDIGGWLDKERRR